MPSICPNCLRPVRTDAKYCGFCGNNLNPTAHDEAAVTIPSPQESEVSKENSTTLKRLKPKGSQVRRVVLIVLIILMCLVLLAAFLVHYWPVLSPTIDVILSLLRLR
jgi:RNA polymerase subunit RPABC4/transcription elongation factor Spt4